MKIENQCEKAITLMDQALYQTLKETDEAWLGQHVSGCNACRSEQAVESQLDSLLIRFVEVEPRRDLWVDVTARIDRASQERRRGWFARVIGSLGGSPVTTRRIPAWAAAPVAAALVFAFVLPTPTPDVPRASAVQGEFVSQTAGNTYLYAHHVLNAGIGTLGDQASRLVMSSVLYPGATD